MRSDSVLRDVASCMRCHAESDLMWTSTCEYRSKDAVLLEHVLQRTSTSTGIYLNYIRLYWVFVQVVYPFLRFFTFLRVLFRLSCA